VTTLLQFNPTSIQWENPLALQGIKHNSKDQKLVFKAYQKAAFHVNAKNAPEPVHTLRVWETPEGMITPVPMQLKRRPTLLSYEGLTQTPTIGLWPYHAQAIEILIEIDLLSGFLS
jgi:hypothetical protein